MQSFKDQNTWLSHFTLFVSVSPHLHLVTLITESASICPVCKDLISDKMSAQGLCGIWYEQWHRSSNASERFFDNPSHDKLYRSCLPIICSVRCLLVKTQNVVCVLSLISALSLFFSLSLSLLFFTVTPGFFSLHKKPHSNPPTAPEKKGITSVYLHISMFKKQEGKHRARQRTRNISEHAELERTNCHWRTKGKGNLF